MTVSGTVTNNKDVYLSNAGSDGLWDETEHPCKTFTVTSSDVYTISWAHLQWEASTTVNAGADFEAMGLAFAEGLTNAETKKHDAISAQIGYGASDNPTDPEWTWKDAAFHSEWGNNFAYQEKIASPSVNGTYYGKWYILLFFPIQNQ